MSPPAIPPAETAAAGALMLDHIGYAVRQIEEYVAKIIRPVFRPQSVSPAVVDPRQQVRIAMVTLQGGARIELIEPLHERSPVSRLLQQRRGGLYHLAYQVANLDAALGLFQAAGFRLVSGPVPAVALGDCRVAFLFSPQADVIELVERRI